MHLLPGLQKHLFNNKWPFKQLLLSQTVFCGEIKETIEFIKFFSIQFASVYEKIGDYLSSSRDQKAVGRRPFDKMATLLAHLGTYFLDYNSIQRCQN